MLSLYNGNENGKHPEILCENEIIFEGCLSQRDNSNSNNSWSKQWIVIHESNSQILLSAFKYSNVYHQNIQNHKPLYSYQLRNDFEISLIHSDEYHIISINNLNLQFGSKSYGVYQQCIKQLIKITDKFQKTCTYNIEKEHKILFIKHSISTYLLPYEQHRIAAINKTFHAHICNISIYNHSQFMRDALYWNKYYHTNKIDFIHTIKSMNMTQLMQAKYNVIYLDKINKTDFIFEMKQLDFASFIKPQMLMIERYSYSSSEGSDYEIDDEYVSISSELQQFMELDRLKYICHVLQYSNFGSVFNTICDINLSDNSLDNNEFMRILNAIKNNKKCIQFSNIVTLNFSQNMFIGPSLNYILLFDLIADKFPNLCTLNLSETGVSNAILDAIIYFNKEYKTHSLKVINVQHCDELFISHKQLQDISAIQNISIIYSVNNMQPQQQLELEFGFDYNFDDISEGDDDENDENKQDIPSLLNYSKTAAADKSVQELQDDLCESVNVNYLKYPDDDEFVYI